MPKRPRIVLAGLKGGAGKTLVSLGLARALARSGKRVAPFKKGPDYIDAAWLGLAARAVPVNLDPFLFPPEKIPDFFVAKSAQADISLIEGNRGLFDGKDVSGSCSTAELARILKTPVLLVLDATKMTRTAAAIVKGVKEFETGLDLAGVILNQTAGARHRNLLTEAIETLARVPVLGRLPKLSPNPIPERHMGLLSSRESGDAEPVLEGLADTAMQHLDIERIWEIAQAAPEIPAESETPELWPDHWPVTHGERPIIGYVRDAALWFYYEENLEALRKAGARLLELSLLDETPWPAIDGLYLGGGFPEVLGDRLAANTTIRRHVKRLSDQGLPIYAECGGFMYLGSAIVAGDKAWPMAGVFPVRTELCAKPQGLGYIEVEVVVETPFFSKGDRVFGHEFHYSRCISPDGAILALAFKVHRGQGMIAGFDGLVHKNTLAAYTHIHALGRPDWAERFVRAAQAQRLLAERPHV